MTLLFSLEGLEILHQEIRGQVNTILVKHFNSILFHKFGPAAKQHILQSITGVCGEVNLRQAVGWYALTVSGL